MQTLLQSGPRIFGVAITGLGILCLAYRSPVRGLEPIPSTAMQPVLGILTGLVLCAAGIAVAIDWHPRRWASVTAMTLGIWLLALHLPNIAARPTDPGAQTVLAETLALFGAAVVLWSKPATIAGAIGREAFAVPMLVFGALHLVYHDFVATLVPEWIPWRLAWAYVTGLAFIAAGLAIALRIRDRLASTALGAMFGLWVVIVHAPRVAGAPANQDEWTSLIIALAMCGGAWAVGRQDSSVAADLR